MHRNLVKTFIFFALMIQLLLGSLNKTFLLHFIQRLVLGTVCAMCSCFTDGAVFLYDCVDSVDYNLTLKSAAESLIFSLQPDCASDQNSDTHDR